MDEALYGDYPDDGTDAGGGRRVRWNFYTFFTAGVYFIGFLTVLGIFWSWFGFRTPDWLVDGRYVELTESRYEAGTVEHFAFDEWKPPRSIGFYLFRHEDGTFTAVGDRPIGCVLVWQSDKDQLFDPCRGAKYPRADLKAASGPEAGPTPGTSLSNLVFLPLESRGDQLLVDLMPLLRGR